MRLLNFTIIKLTICLIIGILIGHFAEIPIHISFYITAFLFILLAVTLLIARKKLTRTIWFGVLGFTSMISIGILTTNLHNEKNFLRHYSNQILNTKDSLKVITFRVREVLKPGTFHDKYIIDILKVDNKSVNGKSLLSIKKDSISSLLQVDDIFITKTEFENIHPPLNPHQFDYKNYLERKYIYHQIFSKNQSLLKISSNPHTLLGFADESRAYINSKLEHYNFKPDVLAIINALFLGQRQNISREVYSNYVNAGAVHILAVSGLHVGIILIILNTLFKPIERLKHGHLLKTFLLIIVLWSFAIIAGLSASVTRAVTMFSIVAIAINLKRPTNIYNTLAISMFVILLFKPLFIFDVGFQLSYLAVFSIVVIDPLLYNLWQPKNWFLNTYWHTLTVTVSAQLGVLPISLYYFHQLPGLFFISNLVIIPLLTIILGYGILIIVLAVLDPLPQLLASTFENILGLMNSFVNWISSQETFVFKDIPFGIFHVITSYFLITTFIRLCSKKNYKTLQLALIAVLFFQISVIYTNYQYPENQFIIFHKNKHSIIGNVTKNSIVVSNDLDSLTRLENKIIRDYIVGNHIKSVKKDTFKHIYLLNKKTVLIIDSLGIYNIKSTRPDYVYLRQSPKINLNRLIDSINPKYIIADGSNYRSYLKYWETICKKRKLPFHQTSKKGAFIINY